MRRRAVLTFLLVLGLLVGTGVTPAAAKGPPPEPVGERINLLSAFFDEVTELDFPAGEPFWIGHGLGTSHGKDTNLKQQVPAVGHLDFELWMDGEEVAEDWTFHGFAVVFDLFQFEGMDGSHAFTGKWFGTCALDQIGVEEGCDRPANTYLFLEWTVEITFG